MYFQMKKVSSAYALHACVKDFRDACALYLGRRFDSALRAAILLGMHGESRFESFFIRSSIWPYKVMTRPGYNARILTYQFNVTIIHLLNLGIQIRNNYY